MCLNFRIRTASTVALTMMPFFVLAANAAMMSVSSTPPVIDNYDIASYGTPTGQDKWWPGLASDFGNPGKTIGQTFTTGSDEVILEAFTFQVRDATAPSKTYTIRVGTVSGSTFTEIASEMVTYDSATAANDYWTWILETPVHLSANTVYGVDVGINESTSSWETGIPYVYYTGDVYADGNQFRSGSEGYGIGDTSMTGMSGDRVFHIDLRYADPNLPFVNAGSNWITWSGEPVLLDPAVVDNNQDPQRSLSYLWTASPADGVAFTPSAEVEAPTVTVTKTTENPSSVKLTLAVTLEGDDPITDTKMIYVYDDACEAALHIGSAEDGGGDFNNNCFTDMADFALLAADWLGVYDLPELIMLAETWLDGALTEPVISSITVPDVTGMIESEAQNTLFVSGLTSSSTYTYHQTVPSNEVISQNPIADLEVPDDTNVSLVVSLGLPPVSELTIAAVYLAQTHVLKPDDSLFKLVGNRPALLKVQVVAPGNMAAPPVTVDLSVGNDSTTLILSGPSVLPTSFQGDIGLVQHQHEDSFEVLIPTEWIRPGLNISVAAGSKNVAYNIKVGAPTVVKMHMYDVHYFGLGNSDYPAGTFEELESKWPVSDLIVERIREINFPELVIPARGGAPCVRVSSKQDYYDQTGLNFDGEQAAALQWVHALSASGGNIDVAMQYINIIGVPAGGQAGGFDGVGTVTVGILNHELGHALSLPHWGNNAAYPYKGSMYGIDPQPGNDIHVGPTWGFDIRSLTYLPPTVQPNTVAAPDLVGYYKKSPMWGGGMGDQEIGYLMRHFSDYGVNKMQNYLEGKVAVRINGDYYKWNSQTGDYTTLMSSTGVNYPIEEDVQVYSVMASLTLADINVNMVYPPIGPYTGNLIRTFDPTNPSDRAAARSYFAPSSGCDFTLKVVQGGVTSYYMLPASGVVGSDPYASSSLKTAAVNLPASDGTITRVDLLLTPDAEDNGLPVTPEVLYTWQ